MPFFDIFNSCQSNHNRNETRTCTDNVTKICSGSNLSCCNNLRQTFNNEINPAPSSDEDDSDSTSEINQVSCF